MFSSGIIKKYWHFFPAVILFIIPFFWFTSGQMDLGGDANRLYFYDPISFLKSTAISVVGTEGKGIVEPKYYYLPYVGMIALLKYLMSSPTIVVSIFNGIKLSIAYLAIMGIVHTMIALDARLKQRQKVKIAAVFAGLFYVVSLGSIHLSFFWDRALFTHDQVFLNPLIFYLLLRFFLSDRYVYLYGAIFTSFIFATSFGLAASPALFAFYPLACLFLVLYIVLIVKKPVPWQKILLGGILFFGIHAFHLLGSIVNFSDSGSITNSVVFSKKEILDGGVNYFTAVRAHGLAILNMLLSSTDSSFRWASWTGPFIILFGFMVERRTKKDFVLVASFFLIIFFFATANITTLGYEAYRNLFYIPGVSMFRVFFEKWMYVYVFFYALMMGFGLYSILLRMRYRYATILCIVFFVLILVSGIPLFSGSLVHQIIRGSKNVQGVLIMDPRYEETLEYIRALPDDGKILVLPLTDSFRQVVTGIEGGVYEGPSTLFHLTHKYGFVGYQNFGYKSTDAAPYAEAIIHYAKDKEYERLLRIFQTLNIRYILHNSDPKAYEESFVNGSFGYMMTFMPKTQAEYKEFISHFPFRRIYENGSYQLNEIDSSSYNPTIFIPKIVYKRGSLSYEDVTDQSVFISNDICDRGEFQLLCRDQYLPQNAVVSFTMQTPARYTVSLKRIDQERDIFLVMQHSFHSGWKVYLNDKIIANNTHVPVNGYANGWIIKKDDLPNNDEIILTIQMDQQKYLYYGIIISTIFLIVISTLFIQSLQKYGNPTKI